MGRRLVISRSLLYLNKSSLLLSLIQGTVTSIMQIQAMNIVLLQNHLGLGMVFAMSLIHLNMITFIAWQMVETVF